MSLAPNPAQGGATQLPGVVPGAQVWVLDALGQAKCQATADQTGAAQLGGLAAGLYLVRTPAGTLHLAVE